jgi:hypothetical protein
MYDSNSLELVVARQVEIAPLFYNGGMDNLLQAIETHVMAFIPDVSTAKGRSEIKSIAYKVAQSKTAIDDAGKNLVADKKKEIQAVDELRRSCRDRLDALKEKVREPLTNWELAEEQRKKRHADRLDELRLLSQVYDENGAVNRSSALETALATAEATVIDGSWEEFQAKAEETKADVIARLQGLIPIARQHEENEREVERLRKEAEERQRRDHEERLRREGEDRAKKALEGKERELLRREVQAEVKAEMQQQAAPPISAAPAEPVPGLMIMGHKEEVREGMAQVFQSLFSVSSTRAKLMVATIDAGGVPNLKIIY